MKLVEVRLRNFRCYRDEISIPIGDLTALIAKNDVGKSSVLDALDAFFNLDKLDSGDRTAGLGNASKNDKLGSPILCQEQAIECEARKLLDAV